MVLNPLAYQASTSPSIPPVFDNIKALTDSRTKKGFNLRFLRCLQYIMGIQNLAVTEKNQTYA